jgi:hypothetical protein
MIAKILTACIGVVVLLGLGMFTTKPVATAQVWQETNIECLPDGHKNAIVHSHAKLTIVVDSVPELIPSHIGDTPECMAEVHTHDASGTVHIEGVKEKKFTLADFFSVWGKSLQREGYVLRASVDGVAIDAPESIPLMDATNIVLLYTATVTDQE